MSDVGQALDVPFTFGLTREQTADIAARQLRSESWPTIAKCLGWEVETLKAFYLGSAPILIATLTAERDAAIAERNEARTEASHLRSRCAAYEAALGEDHADTVSDLAMLSAARDADRAMLGRIIGCEQSDASTVVLLERAEAMIAGLRSEMAVLHATGRVTADDLITVCMGDCGAITEEDSDGCCAGCGNDTALVVGIGSSEAVLEAFEARERRHGPRRVTP